MHYLYVEQLLPNKPAVAHLLENFLLWNPEFHCTVQIIQPSPGICITFHKIIAFWVNVSSHSASFCRIYCSLKYQRLLTTSDGSLPVLFGATELQLNIPLPRVPIKLTDLSLSAGPNLLRKMLNAHSHTSALMSRIP